MTYDQIYRLLTNTPVTLDHALMALGKPSLEVVLRDPIQRKELLAKHVDMAAEHAAMLATEADELEFVWGPQEEDP